MLSKQETDRVLRVAVAAAKKAGRILRTGFNKRMQIHFKGRINPVTEYDLKSERAIIQMITKTFPDHAILSEEGNDRKQKNPCLWVIDPLDGTVNYSHGFPIYCVSVGMLYNGEPLVGVVYDPERNELFSAVRGRKAFLNGKRISVTNEKNIERALVATGFSYGVKKAKRNNLGHFASMIKTAQGVRRPGSAAIDLCWLASGRLDSFWEFDLHPWDTAAAVLILTEAGGKISRVDGSKYSIFDGDIAASNGHLHASLRKILTRRRKKK